MADQRSIDIRKRARDVVELRVDEHRRQRHEDPRPRAQRVMRHVEEQRAAERVFLALRGEDALRDVAAAARLRARIPDRPPRDGQRQDQHRHRQRPVAEIRQQLQRRRRDLRHQPGQAAHLRLLQRVVGGRDRCRHRDHELEDVRDQHAPQAGDRRKRHVDHRAHRQRLPHRPAKQHVGNLRGGEIHRGHDHDVEEQPEIDGAKRAHGGGGRARIANLVELEIGEHARAAPHPRVEEHRAHAGEQERPPHPVVGHAVLANEIGHKIRGVGAERGGYHGATDQPPRRGAARGEELGGARSGAPHQVDCWSERKRDGDDDDDPVERRQLHARILKGYCVMPPVESVLQTIGHTPVVRLRRLAPPGSARTSSSSSNTSTRPGRTRTAWRSR